MGAYIKYVERGGGFLHGPKNLFEIYWWVVKYFAEVKKRFFREVLCLEIRDDPFGRNTKLSEKFLKSFVCTQKMDDPLTL